jgi:hypothetical protein
LRSAGEGQVARQSSGPDGSVIILLVIDMSAQAIIARVGALAASAVVRRLLMCGEG